ncbi:MAG: exodeoxyribonuclease VII large subunit [Lachnospiraceae bacterium]|nr:exodeoxyribonuclease VII large subunit [Lachnospiraceae bacterium]
MKNAFTVSKVNSYIKSMFTQDFMLRSIYVKGEISNVKYHSSGHIYFTLKDDGGTLNAVMFVSYRQKGLSFELVNGQQVIVFGSIEVYERDGKYQLYAREITADGVGALYERFERLKKELEEMGMFDVSYKREIPRYAQTVGIVTAETGAAIWDMIRTAAERNPFVQLILAPAKVEGEGAAESIAAGIRALQALAVDVIIVGRGGGSIENLWAFNEEIVARAIFDCPVPVISGVGHETDFTIADYVADMRVATPTAAAKAAVFELDSFFRELYEKSERLKKAMRQRILEEQSRLAYDKLKLSALSAESRLREKRLHLENCRELLSDLMEKALENRRTRLLLMAERLNGLSPLRRLRSGYALVEKDDAVVNSDTLLQKGDRLKLRLINRDIEATVEKVILQEARGSEGEEA